MVVYQNWDKRKKRYKDVGIVEMNEIIESRFGEAEYPLVSLVSSSASRYADVSPALLNFLINFLHLFRTANHFIINFSQIDKI